MTSKMVSDVVGIKVWQDFGSSGISMRCSVFIPAAHISPEKTSRQGCRHIRSIRFCPVYRYVPSCTVSFYRKVDFSPQPGFQAVFMIQTWIKIDISRPDSWSVAGSNCRKNRLLERLFCVFGSHDTSFIRFLWFNKCHASLNRAYLLSPGLASGER